MTTVGLVAIKAIRQVLLACVVSESLAVLFFQIKKLFAAQRISTRLNRCSLSGAGVSSSVACFWLCQLLVCVLEDPSTRVLTISFTHI